MGGAPKAVHEVSMTTATSILLIGDYGMSPPPPPQHKPNLHPKLPLPPLRLPKCTAEERGGGGPVHTERGGRVFQVVLCLAGCDEGKRLSALGQRRRPGGKEREEEGVLSQRRGWS